MPTEIEVYAVAAFHPKTGEHVGFVRWDNQFDQWELLHLGATFATTTVRSSADSAAEKANNAGVLSGLYTGYQIRVVTGVLKIDEWQPPVVA